MAAAEKRRAFALKKAAEAVACFGEGDWSAGLPKARATLQLLEMLGGAADMPAAEMALLYGGMCLGLAACNRIGEALELYAAHAAEVADESIKERLLHCWVQEANAPMPGDLVQLSGCGGAQLVGLVLAPTLQGGWRVQVRSAATEAAAPDGPGEAPAPRLEANEQVGVELDVAESDLTLLTLRLSEEQRRSWRNLLEERPRLFGQRMRADNEARWQRLFGAAARSAASTAVGGVGAGACGAEADLGLPLEQSFVATLHGLIGECLQRLGGSGETQALTVDLLGCRPALELSEEPSKILPALLEVSPSSLRRLTVRMCGPEVGREAAATSQQLEDGSGRELRVEIRPGLYHDAFPAADADLVVAMNAGVGVPQYAAMWGPTLDLLSRRPRRGLFAITSYTPGELVREERLLRLRWSRKLALAEAPELAEVLHEVAAFEEPPWTLPRDVSVQRGGAQLTLQRGDVLVPGGPACGRWGPAGALGGEWPEQRAVPRQVRLPAAVRILPVADVEFVGPNPTPGRSRNVGRLLMWAGGGTALAEELLRGSSVGGLREWAAARAA